MHEDDVVAFFHNHRGEWFCDDCIAKQFNIKHGKARTIAATLGALGERHAPFERQQGVCSKCDEGDRLVTRRLAN